MFAFLTILFVSELCAAATKIQASFRGHLARKTGDKKEDEELSKELEKLEAKVHFPIIVNMT